MSHNLEVVLVVTSPDLVRPGNSRFLLLTGEDGKYRLPCAGVRDDQSTLEVAADLLRAHTGLRARVLGVGWVDVVPLPLADAVTRTKRLVDSFDGEDRSRDERWVGVPYGAMLPGEVVKLSDPAARWVTLAEAFAGQFYMDHREILEGACHRI